VTRPTSTSRLLTALRWLLLAIGLRRQALWLATVSELHRKLDTLDTQKKALEERVCEAERAQKQNSSNSHKPPSSDRLGERRQIRRKKKPTGKKRGGQPGHVGHYRALMPAAEVDEIIDVFPEYCDVCQQVPPRVKCAHPVRHQLFEVLPNGGGRHVTERRFHCCRCSCGEWLSASLDSMPKSWFGPRLSSLISSLTGKHHQSRRDVVQLLDELFGIHVSLGTVSNIEGRMSQALEKPSDEAMQSVVQAAIKHADETSWIRDFVRCSVWVFASTSVSVFRIVADGTRESLRRVFGEPKGILLSDRATVFLYWAMGQRQICWSHLLRTFVSFSQRDGPAAKLGHELVEYAELVFIYWQQYRRNMLDYADFTRLVQAVADDMKPCLERAVNAAIDGMSGSCANMLAHWEAMWTFIKVAGVEPTNNHAERELRRLVMWRKRCFGSQSERGDRFVERMMTVTHTMRKQNRSSLDYLQQAYSAWFDGKPAPKLLSHGK
jgi:transposase